MRFHRLALFTTSLAFVAGLTACGSTASRSGSDSASTVAGTKAASTGAGEATLPAVVAATAPSTVVTLPAPKVQIPASLPTKLEEKDLRPGTGDPAANGDTVIVNYIGVRSKDGVKFDDSYSKGQPFPVVLGKGSVIKGWDEGLVGVTTGMQRQLDIPGDLAYGTAGQGTVIGPNEALTFVIDVLAVIKAEKAADEPTVSIAPASQPLTSIVTKDLIVGTGPELKDGQTIGFGLVAFRADTAQKVDSSWAAGTPANAKYAADQLLPGIYQGMAGMHVGGRRQISIPSGLAFGAAGQSAISIPANTDLIMVIDLVAAY